MSDQTKRKERAVRPRPRTYEHFPDNVKCPVCHTDDDGETVLVPIDGTGDGHIAEAQCVHLACCVPENFNKHRGLLYRFVS